MNYIDIYFILCLNTVEDNVALYPDELGGGFKKYGDHHIEKMVYKFMCTYIRRIKPNVSWKNLLMKNPGSLFFCVITPSNSV